MGEYLSGRYVPIVGFQILLLLIDFAVNITSILLRDHSTIILMCVAVQLISIVLAFSTIFLLFFATYVYQVGLIELLHERFRHTIIVCLIYFIATVGIDVWSVLIRHNQEFNLVWPTGFIVFLGIHRLIAPIYYYEFKRCFLRISDPRFYENSR